MVVPTRNPVGTRLDSLAGLIHKLGGSGKGAGVVVLVVIMVCMVMTEMVGYWW